MSRDEFEQRSQAMMRAGEAGSRFKETQPSKPLQLMRSYQYIFERPDWFVNLILGTLCTFIPLVGPIVLLGYTSDVTERLHSHPGELYPKFEFNRFVDYLGRGIHPFLVSLIFQIIQMPVMFMVVFAPQLLVFVLLKVDGVMFVGVLITGILVELILVVLAVFVLVIVVRPMMLRAGLSQQIRKAFDVAWLADFTRRMWKQELLVSLFQAVLGMVVIVVGLMLFFVGIYPAIIVLSLVNSHLSYQLYKSYIEKGGELIPLKEQLVDRQEPATSGTP